MRIRIVHNHYQKLGSRGCGLGLENMITLHKVSKAFEDVMGSKNILVVGQTPPPYGGQAVMIEKMLDGQYQGATLYHVRMNFSKDLDEVGRFKFRKVLELIKVIGNTVWMRLKHHPIILYYPPAGPPNILPVFRDVIILMSVRWMFKKTVFHFHAAGLSEIYERLPTFLRWFVKKAYYQPDTIIRLSKFSPPDGELIKAKKEYIVPNGIEDVSRTYLSQNQMALNNSCPRVLYVGVLSEEKGIIILLQACKILCDKGLRFQLELVGKHESLDFKMQVEDFIYQNNLKDIIRYRGVLTGTDKYLAYASSDIFCFPTYASYESFGLVLLEAMSFSLPIVATAWRAIPEIINGKCGFLVPIKDPFSLAEKLELLISNPELRIRTGLNGRQRFLELFTIEKFYEKMDKIFQEL
jgi:glycosyltransferase involved in cell wall biosynthesis